MSSLPETSSNNSNPGPESAGIDISSNTTNNKPTNNSQTGKVVAGTGISLILLYVCSTVLNFWGVPIGSYAPYLVFIIFLIMVKIIIPDKLFVSNNSDVNTSSDTGVSSTPLQTYVVDTSNVQSNTNQAIIPSNNNDSIDLNESEDATWRDVPDNSNTTDL